MTDQVLHCGGSDWAVTGYIIVGGYYTRVKKPLSSQCLRIKWQETTGHAISSSFFFFFQIQNERHVDSQVWLKSYKWQVLIGRFGSAPLPSRILSSFFFLFCCCHVQTHSYNLWRKDLVLHLQCNWHPESNTYYNNMFTHMFFAQQYQRGARQKWFTPREKRKKNRWKEIQIFVPCCNPPQMEIGLTLNTKISPFF